MAGHEAFRAAVEAMDVEAMERCLAPDVVFRSPAVYAPYAGRDAVMTVLRAVTVVFEDFRYVAEYDGPDGGVLVFEANVDELQLQGIDQLTVGADGLVTELTVMVRPYHALERLLQRMGEQLAAAAG